jgi:hypothetical protein
MIVYLVFVLSFKLTTGPCSFIVSSLETRLISCWFYLSVLMTDEFGIKNDCWLLALLPLTLQEWILDFCRVLDPDRNTCITVVV